ncbi:MAG TPA: hypothetical protein O0X38_06255, partial [Methanocorpusculum sp.]|nr:hypothetical protein [Methanocorpusculum sp.]
FWHLLSIHLVPNIIPAIMFVVISSVSACITMESTLSFLGLGLPLDVLSWGSLLSLANRALLLNTWWVIIIPGVFLVVTLSCITSIANYFRKESNKKTEQALKPLFFFATKLFLCNIYTSLTAIS